MSLAITLDTIPLFAHLHEEELARIGEVARERSYPKNSVISALGLLRALSKRLRQADSKIGGLVLLDVAGRIARLLLQLADEGNCSVITAKLTHHTITQMIGSSRETVSRTIRALIEQDLIGVSQKASQSRTGKRWNSPPDYGELHHRPVVTRCIA